VLLQVALQLAEQLFALLSLSTVNNRRTMALFDICEVQQALLVLRTQNVEPSPVALLAAGAE